jgi:hypothetical protein
VFKKNYESTENCLVAFFSYKVGDDDHDHNNNNNNKLFIKFRFLCFNKKDILIKK